MPRLNPAKISLTAKLAAYMRQFSDIPFAVEVARQLHAREALEELLAGQSLRANDLLGYAPIFEARYKSLTEAVRRSAATQVIELASGFALRGLALTRAAGWRYVETDLAAVTAEKEALVAELCQQAGEPIPAQLHLIAANALEPAELQAAAGLLRRDRPVAILHEGLVPYLPAAELSALARNIHALLVERGGVWITPDFSLKAEAAAVSEPQRRFRQIVTAATEHAMYPSAFADHAQLTAFIQEHGFQAQVFQQLDLAPDLVSPARLNLPAEILAQAGPTLRMWVLSPAA